MRHPTNGDMAAYIDGTLDQDRRATVDLHVRRCVACRTKVKTLKADTEFIASLMPALKADKDQVLDIIDRIVLPKLTASLSRTSGESASTKVFAPSGKPSHPEAPAIPDYKLIEKLGGGAFGTVWRAEGLIGNPCAVKVLPRRHKKQTGERELEGIRQAMQVKHPNLVSILHVGELDQYWYYVMELVGETLEQRLERQLRFSPEEVQTVITALLEALVACHNQGIAHRDIKPANIGFTADGTLKLLDLGLVTSAARGDRTLIGTPDYMPNKPSKTPALDDLYAASMVLYRMLTGNDPGRFPEIPADIKITPVFSRLNQAALHAAEELPEKRFQSAEEFLGVCARSPDRSRISKVNDNGSENQPCNDQEEIDMQNSFQKAGIGDIVKFLEANHLPVSEALHREWENIENPTYTIAIVGRYQVGKSTLINKVFIRDDILLKEGAGLCTTAVTTNVAHGDRKQLVVTKWIKRTDILKVEASDKSDKQEVEVVVGEAPATTIDDPSPDDVARYTTATRLEDRTALAAETASVRLNWPCESLRRYTLCDTPGVDDPNQALLSYTTYRVIPSADLAILVVGCAALGQIEMDFLRSRVFDAGISRVMVMVSYRPDSNRDAATRSEILSEIKAQLANIGRPHVPVVMYCFDGSVGGDILNSADDIELAILAYLDGNVGMARAEKAAALAKQALRAALVEVAAKIAIGGKDEKARQNLLDDLQRKESELRGKYNELAEDICGDLALLNRRIAADVPLKINGVIENYVQSLKQSPDFGAARERLEKAEIILRPELEKIAGDIRQVILEGVGVICTKYQQKAARISSAWDDMLNEKLDIDGGILGKIPSTLVKILDYMIFILLGPFGPIGDIILRFLLAYIPIIKKILPSALAKLALVHSVKTSLGEKVEQISSIITGKIDEAFAQAQSAVRRDLESAMDSELNLVKDAAKDFAPGAMGAAKRQRLECIKNDLERMMTAI